MAAKMKRLLPKMLPLITLWLLQLAQVQCDDVPADVKSNTIGVADIVFIVLSQPNEQHVKRAAAVHESLKMQTKQLDIPPDHLTFLYLHKEWPGVGSWTIKPIITSLASKFKSKKLVLFFEDETNIIIDKLIEKLNTLDFAQKQFLGDGLRDQEATIIHHFAFHQNPGSFVYPDFASGFILSLPLIKELAERISSNKQQADFSIDVKHELAKFIWDEGEGIRLTEVPFLCSMRESKDCASSFKAKLTSCKKNPVSNDDLFVAVKTYHGNHKDRVPVVKKTWGAETKNLEFYSDVEDKDIPTIDLGVPNTERGHCGKLLAILKRAHQNPAISKHDWLLVADDDTLISLPRLRRLLSCYNAAEPVALGERYGYGVAAGYGYDYITGGGGMVLSHSAVSQLVESSLCTCAANDSPDDMTLGMCLKRLAIPVTHSPLFHQARPADYSKGYLSHQMPVSFHKHWMVDPFEVYQKWLYEEPAHDEL